MNIEQLYEAGTYAESLKSLRQQRNRLAALCEAPRRPVAMSITFATKLGSDDPFRVEDEVSEDYLGEVVQTLLGELDRQIEACVAHLSALGVETEG